MTSATGLSHTEELCAGGPPAPLWPTAALLKVVHHPAGASSIGVDGPQGFRALAVAVPGAVLNDRAVVMDDLSVAQRE